MEARELKNESEMATLNPDIRAALSALSSRVERIEQALWSSHETYADCFDLTEATLAVLQKCFNDYMNGSLRMKVDAKGDEQVSYRIDFISYMQEFYVVMSFAKFIENLKRVIGEQQPLLVAADENSPIIFGG